MTTHTPVSARTRSRIVGRRALVACMAVGAVLGGTFTAGPVAGAQPATPAWDHTPPKFRSWISQKAPTCPAPAVTPRFVAAQLNTESGFRTDVVSAAGAIGPAQLPPTAPVIDADGDGANPRDVADAVTTLVAIDCDIATHLIAAGHTPDQPTIAAAYNTGLNAVLSNHIDPVTGVYVAKVMQSQ